MTDCSASTIDQLQARIAELEAQLADRQSQVERLSASEARFRAIAEHANDIICTINYTNAITYLSPNVAIALGYSSTELTGQSFTPLIHPEDLPTCTETIRQVMETGQPYSGLEYRVLHKQGRYVWHRANLSVYPDETGQPVLIAIGRDVDSQKRTEAELAQNRAQFEAILQNANVAIFAKDLEGRYIFANPWVVEEVGIPIENILGKSDADLLPPEVAARFQENDRRALETGKPTREEELVSLPDGDRAYLAIKFPLVGSDGQPYAICGISTNITDLKRTEAELRASEARFNEILSNVLASIDRYRIYPDKTWELEYFSPGSIHVWGFTSEELLADPFLLSSRVHPDDLAPVIQEQFFSIVEAGGTGRIEYRHHHPTLGWRWVAVNVSSAWDEAASCWLVTTVATDISDRKHIEEALRTSEARLNRILDRISACVADYRNYSDRTFVPDYFSSGSLQLWGFTPEELLEDPEVWTSRFEPEDLQTIFTEAYDYIFNERPYKYAYRYHHPDGNLRWIEFSLTSYRDEDDDCWRTTVISTDITDRKNAEAALKASEARLNHILDSTLASIGRYRIYADYNWEMDYFSSGTTEIWGFTPEELLADKQLQFDRVHPEDLETIIYSQVFPAIFAEQTARFEYRYFHPQKNEWRWIGQTVSSIRDEAADCWLATVIATDVTDRKRAEEALRESEAKLNRILDRTTASIADYRVYPDKHFVAEYFSSGSLQLWGFTPEELLADLTPWHARYEPADLQTIFENAYDYIFNERPYTCEYRYHHPDGSLRWIQLSLTSYWDEAAGCWRTPTVSIDISDRKRAEAALARSEARFRQIVENASDLIATVTTDGNFTYLSPNILEFCGYTDTELIGQNCMTVVHPDDVETCVAVLSRVLETGESGSVDYRLLHRDGSFRYFVVNVSMYQDADGNPLILGISRDLTERRRLEEELRRSEAQFRRIVENANDTIATVTPEGIITYLSPNFLQILGRDASELVGTSFAPLVHPDDVPHCYESIQKAIESKDGYVLEYRLRDRDGNYRHFVSNTSLFTDENGSSGILGISRDVSEQKRLEEELRQSEAKFRAIVENANDLIYLINEDGIITYMSPNVHLGLGYQPEELQGQPFMPLVHPEDLDWAVTSFRRVLEGETMTVEVRSRHRDGSWRWFSCQVSPFCGSNGELLQLGIARDITDRKQLEEELRQSELKFRTIVEQANDIIYTLDQDGNTSYVSPNIAAILGITETELIMDHFSQRVHPEDLEVVAETVQRTLAGEKTTVECRARHQDGSWRWLDCNLAPLPTVTGELGIMGIARDISDRKHLEEELRQSEYKFRAIVENANDLIYVIDQSGRIAYMSPNSAAIHGYSPEEMEERTFDQFVHPDDLPLGAEAVARAIAGESFSFELRSFHKDGSIRWFSSNVAPFRMANGEMGLMGIGRDVTDRKQAEEALQRSERKYRNIFENSHVGIGRARLSDAIFLECNQLVAEVLGFDSPNDLIGQDWGQFCATEAEALRIATMLQEQGVIRNEEIRLRRRDGALRWFLSFTRVNFDEDCIDFVVADITDRKRLEEDLRQSQQFLHSVIETIPFGFFAKDVRNDYRYVLINKCAERVMGFSREQGLGRHDYELLSKAQADYYWQQDQAVIQLQTLVETPEAEIVSSEGDRFLIRSLKFPFFDEQGNLTHLLCLTDDITERKQREEELRLAKDAAEAANRAKSIFLANMSHELRTPLNVILGFTQLMERENALSDRQRNFLTTINRSGEHLLNLINDVLEMSKIEAGRITLNPEPFDLRHLLNTLQEMFQIRAEAKHLSLSFDLAPDLPTSVIADQGKLRQVLINLLSNAVKFTEQGGITLQVDIVDIEEVPEPSDDAPPLSPTQNSKLKTQNSPPTTRTTLEFSVADTGIGIAPEEIEQLFQPFVQTTGGIQVKEGTGLGLTISRQFVDLMGGEMEVLSTPGQGSVFMFHIPVTLLNGMVSTPGPLRRRVLGLAPDQPTYRLLIVDDRTDNRTLLTHLLQPFGFETRTASNGQEAIALWQSWQPHLIWMDMRMPILDGYEATRQIRALEQVNTPSTKIIALTASAFEEQRTTILEAGCDDFVRKPFREQVLFDKLTEHLGVQFLYTEMTDGELGQGQVSNLQPLSLRVMPPEWIQAAREAATAIDGDRLLHLIAEIPPEHTNLASQLRELVNRFDFDEILERIDLECIDLAGTDLAGTDLAGTDLERSDGESDNA